MAFHDTDGTSISHKIPEDLGGFYLYSDGPVSAASSTVGTIVYTWTLEYKGVRMDDNVVTAVMKENRLLKKYLKKCKAEDLCINDVVLMEGK